MAWCCGTARLTSKTGSRERKRLVNDRGLPAGQIEQCGGEQSTRAGNRSLHLGYERASGIFHSGKKLVRRGTGFSISHSLDRRAGIDGLAKRRAYAELASSDIGGERTARHWHG